MNLAAVMLPLVLGAPPPAIIIEATYPGANPRVVADTVAAPLEQQLLGMEGRRRLRTLCTDGRCVIRVELTPRSDVLVAQVLAQNRAALATPTLPEECRRLGVLVRRVDSGGAFDLVVLEGGREHDAAYLTAVAEKLVRPALTRLVGVASADVLGGVPDQIRVVLDPDRLAALGLTASDVLTALREAPDGKTKRGVEETGNLTVATREQVPIRLKDVGRVEVGGPQSEYAGIVRARGDRGGAAVFIAVGRPHGQPRPALAKALDELKEKLPPGVRVRHREVVPGEGLAATVVLPDGASLERREDAVRRIAEAAARVEGVGEVEWLVREGESDLIYLLPPAGGKPRPAEELRAALRKAFAEFREASVTLGRQRAALSPLPGEGMDLVVKLFDDDALGAVLSETAERLLEEMAKLPAVADARAEFTRSIDMTYVEVDRVKAAAMGVRVADVLAAAEMALGGTRYVTEAGKLVVRIDGGERRGPRGIDRVKVRNLRDEMVPLKALVSLQEVSGPRAVYRENGRPCVVLSCNVAGKRDEVIKKVRELANGHLRKGLSFEIED